MTWPSFGTATIAGSRACIAVLAAVLLLGASGVRAQEDTPTETATPEDTETATATPANTATPTPHAPFVVDSNGDAGDDDAGDGMCATAEYACTLRAAIEEANALAGADTITFLDAMTITPGSALPAITETTTISGASHATCCTGTPPNISCASATWGVKLDLGNNDYSAAGIRLGGTGSSVTGIEVRSVAGNDNNGIGIQVSGNDATVTCTNTHDNAVSGISSNANGATIGGGAGAANWVHDNGNHGVWLSADTNVVSGNLIGTTANGYGRDGNGGDGIYVQSGSDNDVNHNVASANGGKGVTIGSSASNTAVSYNLIGRNAPDTANLCNDGNPQLNDSGTNTITANNTIGDCIPKHCCQLANGICVDNVLLVTNYGITLDDLGGCEGAASLQSSSVTTDAANDCNPAGDTSGQCVALPTATPTAAPDTPTPTPKASQDQILSDNDTCASPPCDLHAVLGGAGYKTIVVSTNEGTATVLPICRNGPGNLQSEVALGSLTGASCTTTANCLLTTPAWCDEVFLRITACSSCRITSWLRRDLYYQR